MERYEPIPPTKKIIKQVRMTRQEVDYIKEVLYNVVDKIRENPYQHMKVSKSVIKAILILEDKIDN